MQKKKNLLKKKKAIKGIGAFLESFGDSQSEYTGTPGFMIKGSGISTPEITRYQGGGIANMDPIMMADGGIAKFAPGGAVAKAALKKVRKV